MEKQSEKVNKHHCRYEFDEFAKDYRVEQSKYYAAYTKDTSEFFAELKIQKLLSWLPELSGRTGMSILDYGCGDGYMTSVLARYLPGNMLYGTDPSAQSIEIAQKLHPHIAFDCIEETVVPYADHRFDLICTAGVFHHIPFDEHGLWLDELMRILKPNGRLVMFELNPLNPLTRYIFKYHPMDQQATMLTPWYARRLLGKFGKVSVRFYYFFPSWLRFLRVIDPLFERWCPISGLYAVILKRD